MKALLLAVSVAVATAAALWSLPSQAHLVDSTVRSDASQAAVFDTFHDAATGFVFVRLPQGWRFVGEAPAGDRIEVFRDRPTDYVYVRTANGWRFAGVAADKAVLAQR